MIDPIIELSLRLGLAGLLGAAAWHKASDHVRFGGTVHAYRLLPAWLVSPVTWLVPVAEAALALGLLLPGAREAATVGALLLLLLYTAAIAVNLARGRREIDCGCFASSARVPLSVWLVARNAILIVATGSLLMPVGARSFVWIDALTVVGALVALSLLWSAGQRLAQTGPVLRKAEGTS